MLSLSSKSTPQLRPAEPASMRDWNDIELLDEDELAELEDRIDLRQLDSAAMTPQEPDRGPEEQ